MPVSIDIVNHQGQAAGTIEVADALLGQPENLNVVRATLDCYLANQRQGTAKTKVRGEVRGGGIKPWKQKGTGRARSGSRRSPLWVGGGTSFGPIPRDYRYRINRKVRQSAFTTVLSSLLRDKRLIVLDSLELPETRTREVLALRGHLGIGAGMKVLVLTEAVDEGILRAARNLGGNREFPTRVRPLNNINIFDLLGCDYLVLTTGGIKALEEMYS
jgi:large subunit ribosomal protein L4